MSVAGSLEKTHSGVHIQLGEHVKTNQLESGADQKRRYG